MSYFTALPAAQARALTDYIERTQSAQADALAALIRIPGVKEAALPGRPFGAHMFEALQATLDMAASLGLYARNLDGYAGIVDYGEGDETLGVLTHIDVVPAGEGWTVPAFGGEIHDGRLYGRGAIDNKGPLVSTVFALAAIKEVGIPLKRRVRLIAGCDEESGWGCMAYYRQMEPLPELAFSPDACYPLVFSERCIVHAAFTAKNAGSALRVRAGERANVVPGVANAVVPRVIGDISLPGGFSYTQEEHPDGAHIRINGLGAHASRPENGKNALLALIGILAAQHYTGRDGRMLDTLHSAFSMDMHGEHMGLDCTDESGRITVNPGILSWERDAVRLTIDARIPHMLSSADYLARLGAALEPAGFTLTDTYIQNGIFVPRESELVSKLMGVYRAQTGDMQSEPLAIGGGTYARAMPMAVAFGCEYPGEPDRAHMPDEYITLTDLWRNTHMMADAMLALAAR